MEGIKKMKDHDQLIPLVKTKDPLDCKWSVAYLFKVFGTHYVCV